MFLSLVIAAEVYGSCCNQGPLRRLLVSPGLKDNKYAAMIKTAIQKINYKKYLFGMFWSHFVVSIFCFKYSVWICSKYFYQNVYKYLPKQHNIPSNNCLNLKRNVSFTYSTNDHLLPIDIWIHNCSRNFSILFYLSIIIYDKNGHFAFIDFPNNPLPSRAILSLLTLNDRLVWYVIYQYFDLCPLLSNFIQFC